MASPRFAADARSLDNTHQATLPPMPRVLLLTGTCGSGKTTVAKLLVSRSDWTRLAEDDIWPSLFGKSRGAFGSEEHRRKRSAIHEVVFPGVKEALAAGRYVVIEATVHETPPEALLEYQAFFEGQDIRWTVRVLHPRLEVAVARDAARPDWRAGESRVASLRVKFSGLVFPPEWFIDTSDQTPGETVAQLLRMGVV